MTYAMAGHVPGPACLGGIVTSRQLRAPRATAADFASAQVLLPLHARILRHRNYILLVEVMLYLECESSRELD